VNNHVAVAGNTSTQLFDTRLQTLYQEQLSAIVPLQLGMAAIAQNFDASLQSLGTVDAILDGLLVFISLLNVIQSVIVNVTIFVKKLRTLLEEVDMAAARVFSQAMMEMYPILAALELWELRLERLGSETGAVE
jgi:hypothetical protein